MRFPPVSQEQSGLFSRAQAAEAGWSKGAVDRALAAGRVVALAPGVFVDPARLASASRRDRHLLEARALVHALGDRWHLARRSAAVAHGLPLIGRAPAVVQLSRPKRGASQSPSRHRRVLGLPEDERVTVDGLPCTSIARTVFDLARAESFRSGVVVADAALRAGVSRAQLLAVVQRHSRWPGARRAASVIDFADGRSESPLESLARAVCLEAGLPVFEPQVQVWVDGRLVARVDGLWRERLVVFEGDGGVKFEEDGAVPALLVRQERLREAGLPVVRGFWPDVTGRRAAWARGVRRELAERSGTLRPGVELRPTPLWITPLDRSDHYRWPPLPSATPRQAPRKKGARRGAAKGSAQEAA